MTPGEQDFLLCHELEKLNPLEVHRQVVVEELAAVLILNVCSHIIWDHVTGFADLNNNVKQVPFLLPVTCQTDPVKVILLTHMLHHLNNVPELSAQANVMVIRAVCERERIEHVHYILVVNHNKTLML